MKNFLHAEAEKYRHIGKDEAQELRMAFKSTCQIIRSMLGKNAFKRFHKGTDKNPAGYWEPKRFNASLYDVLMYTFAREDTNVVYQHLDSIKEALIYLMTENQEFIDAIELSTSSLQAVTKRFDLLKMETSPPFRAATRSRRARNGNEHGGNTAVGRLRHRGGPVLGRTGLATAPMRATGQDAAAPQLAYPRVLRCRDHTRMGSRASGVQLGTGVRSWLSLSSTCSC